MPDPTDVPPQDPEYHSQLAPVPNDPPLTDNEAVSPSHIVVCATEIELAAIDSEFTVTVTD